MVDPFEYAKEEQDRINKEQMEKVKLSQIKTDIENEVNLENLREEIGGEFYDRI